MNQGNDLFPLPWRNESDHYGYIDSTGKFSIKPEFNEASPMIKNYAVVQTNNRYSVIDSNGNVVVPSKYQFIERFTYDQACFVACKKEYNGWWRFWEWKLFPEFNIFSTKHSGPWLVTKVPRAKWKFIMLPKRRVLKRRRLDDSTGYLGNRYWHMDWKPMNKRPFEFQVDEANSYLLVDETLYILDGKRLKRKARSVVGSLDNQHFLRKKGKQFVLLDPDGRKVRNRAYTKLVKTSFQTTWGEDLTVGHVIQSYVFMSEQGNRYVYPYVTRPLPNILKAHPTFGELSRIHYIAAHPGLDCFIIIGSGRAQEGSYCLLLRSNGEWIDDLPPLQGFHYATNHGLMVFDNAKVKTIVDVNLQVYHVPMGNIQPLRHSTHLFSGKDNQSGKHGIYDLKTNDWIIAPEYNFLGQELVQGVIVYYEMVQQREQCGLLQFKNNKRLTKPLYQRIDDDSKAWKLEDGKMISFYLCPETGEELRGSR